MWFSSTYVDQVLEAVTLVPSRVGLQVKQQVTKPQHLDHGTRELDDTSKELAFHLPSFDHALCS